MPTHWNDKNKKTIEEAIEENIAIGTGYFDFLYNHYGDDYVIAKMPVNSRVHQPDGVLHGGATVQAAGQCLHITIVKQIKPILHNATIILPIMIQHTGGA